EPEDRLPFATEYTATVPAGVKSANGQALKKPIQWRFKTQRPKLLASVPREGSEEATPEGRIGLLFNCKVDPQAIARGVSLTTKDGLLRKLLGRADIDLEVIPRSTPNDPGASLEQRLNWSWEAERSVWLKPAQPLAPGKSYTLQLSDALRCAEGPLPMGE